jgi:hypothetical protein
MPRVVRGIHACVAARIKRRIRLSFSEEKEAKRLLSAWTVPAPAPRENERTKVFWFFFEKRRLLSRTLLIYDRISGLLGAGLGRWVTKSLRRGFR